MTVTPFLFYENKIPDAEKRPAALLELLGCGARRSSSATICSAGSLTSREASAACKCAVSILLPPPAEKAERVDDGGSAGELAAGGGGGGGSGEGGLNRDDAVAGGGDGLVFPLDIDQEVGDFMMGVGDKVLLSLVLMPTRTTAFFPPPIT